jgi:type I restriction enzyme S subunit
VTGAWPMVSLGEICEIQRGGSPRPISNYITESEDGINWIKIGDVAVGAKYLYATGEKIKPEGAKRSRMVYPGDFILSNSMSFGRPYIMRTSGCIHDGWLVLRDTNKRLSEDYLYRVLGSDFVVSQFKKMAVGAVVKNLNKEVVQAVVIPLPPLPEQRRIAAILDQADALRAKRREALAQLDSLTQSIFIEMLGDPSTNPNKFKVHSLGSICDVRDGTHDSPKYESSGFPLVTTKNLRNGVIDFTDVNLISETDYTAINKRSKVDKGDILMPMIGTIGSPILVWIEPNFAIKNMALIKFTKDSPHSQFILSFLKSAAFEKLVASESKGGTQKFLSLGAIRGLQIPVPPRTLQKEFATAMEAVQLQIIRTLNSLSAMEILFSSLQHRAFRGEL